MPLPIILGIAAGIAAAGGIGSGVHGGVKLKKAGDTMKAAQKMQQNAVNRFKTKSDATSARMDKVGEEELRILDSFGRFVDLIERIQNRPEFAEYDLEGVSLPQYEPEQLKKVSAGAGLVIGGLSGAAAGTAGGFAAAGATTAAVMALGTASTGTAIASLSGAAATNATLAALGGGAIAAGGGGMALGTTILGASTLGVGLLVGGVIFSITGSKLSGKADEAYAQAKKTKKEVDQIVVHLDKLSDYADKFLLALKRVNRVYTAHLSDLDTITSEKTNWNDFSPEEKLTVKNTILLVGLLFKMCQVKLVLKEEGADGTGEVNTAEVINVTSESQTVLESMGAQVDDDESIPDDTADAAEPDEDDDWDEDEDDDWDEDEDDEDDDWDEDEDDDEDDWDEDEDEDDDWDEDEDDDWDEDEDDDWDEDEDDNWDDDDD